MKGIKTYRSVDVAEIVRQRDELLERVSQLERELSEERERINRMLLAASAAIVIEQPIRRQS